MSKNPEHSSYGQIGQLCDFLSAGAILISPQRKVLAMNRTAQLLTGKSESDAQGHFCHRLFGDVLCGQECIIDGAQKKTATMVTRQMDWVDEHQQHHRLLKMALALAAPDRNNGGWIEIVQDVSAISELVERIGNEERRLRSILDHLDIAMFSCDRGGHITFFNRMAETITGFRRQQLLGKPCGEVLGAEICQEVSTDGDHPARELNLITHGGRAIPVAARQIPLNGGKGASSGRLTTFSDLSLVHQYKRVLKNRYTFQDMIGSSPAMQNLFEILPSVAESNATVLIEGPTGTGKDLMANVIHSASRRCDGPLVKVNCAAMPGDLLESEMFGYVRGAFTGADRDKPGRFQDADGGTLFLDEIGDMPLGLQAKLLRVLEDKEFYPLGSRKTTKVNVRILSATNQNLAELVHQKRFREDLFYRLNVMRIELPPLKERRADISLLINHILKRLCQINNVQTEGISQEAMQALLNYDYPGNVRELENILAHALIIRRGATITRQDLPNQLRQIEPGNATPAKPITDEPLAPQTSSFGNQDRETVVAALRRNRWNRNHTAAELGIDRTTLWRKMKKYGIEP